jgi:hypothetical protein
MLMQELYFNPTVYAESFLCKESEKASLRIEIPSFKLSITNDGKARRIKTSEIPNKTENVSSVYDNLLFKMRGGNWLTDLLPFKPAMVSIFTLKETKAVEVEETKERTFIPLNLAQDVDKLLQEATVIDVKKKAIQTIIAKIASDFFEKISGTQSWARMQSQQYIICGDKNDTVERTAIFVPALSLQINENGTALRTSTGTTSKKAQDALDSYRNGIVSGDTFDKGKATEIQTQAEKDARKPLSVPLGEAIEINSYLTLLLREEEKESELLGKISDVVNAIFLQTKNTVNE